MTVLLFPCLCSFLSRAGHRRCCLVSSVPSERRLGPSFHRSASEETPKFKRRSAGTDEHRRSHSGLRSFSSGPPRVASVQFCSQLWHAVCLSVCEQKKYKSRAKDLLKSGCNELLRPDILTALCQSVAGSKVNRQRPAAFPQKPPERRSL